MERPRRKEQIDQAYAIQARYGTLSAIKSTGYGLGLVMFAHYAWPLFRRQTLAIKGFLVSTFTIFGLVVGADAALLSHEAEQRFVEDRLRGEARNELARQGKIATEREIAKWMMNRETHKKSPRDGESTK